MKSRGSKMPTLVHSTALNTFQKFDLLQDQKHPSKTQAGTQLAQEPPRKFQIARSYKQLFTCTFYTQELLHTQIFTYRPLLHTDVFTDVSTHRSFYTQTLLHTGTFTHRRFTHRRFYTQTFLHTDPFKHRRFLHGTS